MKKAVMKYIKKAAAVIIMVLLCINNAGCEGLTEQLKNMGLSPSSKAAESATQEVTVPQPRLPGSYEVKDIKYGFYSLKTDFQKNLYKKFIEVMNSIDDIPDDDGFFPLKKIEMNDNQLTEGGIRIVIEAFSCDHPEVFWLSNTFGYYTDKNITMVHLYSNFSKRQVVEMKKELNAAVESFINEVPSGMGEYEREKFVHDKIINDCDYADNIKSSRENPTAFSIYGALVEHSAVCEGYTKATQYILKMVGIQSISVNGYSKSELHQWCIVNINRQWYHLDTTWDEKQVSEEDERDKTDDNILYFYFNTTDSYIEADHKIAKPYTALTEEQLCGQDIQKTKVFNMPLPTCTSEKDTFYNREGAYLSDFYDEDEYNNIINKMYIIAQNRTGAFYLKIADSLNFNTTVDQLFYVPPYYFFEYTTDINIKLQKQYGKKYRISDRITMSTLEEQKIIKIELSYEKWG